MTSQSLKNIGWWKVTRLRNLNGSSAQNPSLLGWLRAWNFHTFSHPTRRTSWYQEQAGITGMIADQLWGKRPERYSVKRGLSIQVVTEGHWMPGWSRKRPQLQGSSQPLDPGLLWLAALPCDMWRMAYTRSVGKAVVKPAMGPRMPSC